MMLLAGCSPAHRFTRLVERYPGLVRDTVLTVRDTVVLPGLAAIDTVVPWPATPAVFETPRLTARLEPVLRKPEGKYAQAFRRADKAFDSAFGLRLQVDLKPDTVIVEKEVSVPVYRTQTVKKRWPWWIIPVSLGETVVLVFLLKLK